MIMSRLAAKEKRGGRRAGVIIKTKQWPAGDFRGRHKSRRKQNGNRREPVEKIRGNMEGREKGEAFILLNNL